MSDSMSSESNQRATLTLDPKWIQAVEMLLPIVFLLIPRFPALLVPVVIHGIEEAQAIPGASGIEKKNHVLELVKLSAAGINAAAHRIVINIDRDFPLIERGIDLAMSVVGILHPHK